MMAMHCHLNSEEIHSFYIGAAVQHMYVNLLFLILTSEAHLFRAVTFYLCQQRPLSVFVKMFASKCFFAAVAQHWL